MSELLSTLIFLAEVIAIAITLTGGWHCKILGDGRSSVNDDKHLLRVMRTTR